MASPEPPKTIQERDQQVEGLQGERAFLTDFISRMHSPNVTVADVQRVEALYNTYKPEIYGDTVSEIPNGNPAQQTNIDSWSGPKIDERLTNTEVREIGNLKRAIYHKEQAVVREFQRDHINPQPIEVSKIPSEHEAAVSYYANLAGNKIEGYDNKTLEDGQPFLVTAKGHSDPLLIQHVDSDGPNVEEYGRGNYYLVLKGEDAINAAINKYTEDHPDFEILEFNPNRFNVEQAMTALGTVQPQDINTSLIRVSYDDLINGLGARVNAQDGDPVLLQISDTGKSYLVSKDVASGELEFRDVSEFDITDATLSLTMNSAPPAPLEPQAATTEKPEIIGESAPAPQNEGVDENFVYQPPVNHPITVESLPPPVAPVQGESARDETLISVNQMLRDADQSVEPYDSKIEDLQVALAEHSLQYQAILTYMNSAGEDIAIDGFRGHRTRVVEQLFEQKHGVDLSTMSIDERIKFVQDKNEEPHNDQTASLSTNEIAPTQVAFSSQLEGVPNAMGYGVTGGGDKALVEAEKVVVPGNGNGELVAGYNDDGSNGMKTRTGEEVEQMFEGCAVGNTSCYMLKELELKRADLNNEDTGNKMAGEVNTLTAG